MRPSIYVGVTALKRKLGVSLINFRSLDCRVFRYSKSFVKALAIHNADSQIVCNFLGVLRNQRVRDLSEPENAASRRENLAKKNQILFH